LVSCIQHQDNAATHYHAKGNSYPTVFLKDVHRGPTVRNTGRAALHNRLQRLDRPTNDGRYVWFQTVGFLSLLRATNQAGIWAQARL
jgi:hypothetical protein